MACRVREAKPPRGLLRWLLRAPIALYEAGLGPLFGRRLLMLESIGHRTGLPRRTVLEVVHRDAANTYYVAAGFGLRSHWYRNVLRHPEVQISVGRRRLPVYARPVEGSRAGEILAGYAREHPHAARVLMRWLGFEVDGSDTDYRAVAVSLGLRLIAFVPRHGRAASSIENAACARGSYAARSDGRQCGARPTFAAV